MRQRDKRIIDTLSMFRCMTRDQIADLFFSTNRSKTSNCNLVLKRLRRDGHIQADTTKQPYIYYPNPATTKIGGQKTNHYLLIVNFYKQVLMYGYPKEFVVEPKFQKGEPEPDIYMHWKGAPWFVEIQRSIYSEKMIADKIKRYEAYFLSDKWADNRKYFGHVWLITEREYNVKSELFRVFQSKDVNEFMDKNTTKSQ